MSVGPYEECFALIPLAHRSGVDAEVIVCESFDIAQARALAEKAATRPIAGEKRYFVVSCAYIPHEAQNALLKLFEDPPATAQFYIIVPRAELILPTLRSRLHVLYESPVVGRALNPETSAFLGAAFADRLEQIAMLAKAKDAHAMRVLINGIERAAGFGVGKYVREKQDVSYLADVLMASTYAETRGASHKMLLEHLALSIPEKAGR